MESNGAFFKFFLVAMQLIILIAFQTNIYSYAVGEEAPVIVLVDLHTWDLADSEMDIFNDKKILEVTRIDGWQDIVSEVQAVDVVVKHQSGYCGLYTAQGEFIREITLKDQDIPSYYNEKFLPNGVETQKSKHWRDPGYANGGLVDPYRPHREARNDEYKINDYKRLNPGWGYKTVDNRKGVSGHIFDFMRIAPLSTVTPFNYPGTYGGNNLGLASAWSLGAIPAIGGLVGSIGKAKRDQENYDRALQAQEQFIDYPVQYYNSIEPTNPISRDPNFTRLNNPPMAFTQQQPNYARDADYYRRTGHVHP
ncbi:MAG: hypothetical protein MK033_02005 [Candidatus Caenarcaniphilales bacterium]|nr:hypothetical protein [Candidatus Caenarcaniphilales bacterium]